MYVSFEPKTEIIGNEFGVYEWSHVLGLFILGKIIKKNKYKTKYSFVKNTKIK